MDIKKQYPLGSKIDYDGQFGYHCFDFGNQYHLDLTGYRPKILLMRACDIWYNPKAFFNDAVEYDRIENRPDNFPIYGDLIIWSENLGGGYGHVATVLEADINSFTVREQDGLLQTGVKDKTYPNYANVLGWYRIKTKKSEFENQNIQERWSGNIYYENLVKDKNIRLAVNDLIDRDLEIKNLREQIQNYKNQIEELRGELYNKDRQIELNNQNYKKDFDQMNKQQTILTQKIKELESSQKVDAVNQPQTVFENNFDTLAKSDIKTNQTKENHQISTNKPFWQSKKFASLVFSSGLGALAIYFDVQNLDVVLQTLASVEMTYLGSQTLIDAGVVKTIVNQFKK